MTTDTRLSHVYNLIWQRDYDNRFSTWLFYILVSFFLFAFFTSYCCFCYEGALKKIDQMRSEYHILIFWRILVQINAKEFSENSRESLGFSRTILLWNFARSREYKQYRKQKQRQQKGDENRNHYEVTKTAPSAFSQERYLFWDGKWGFRREGRGKSNLICQLSPGESHPFELDKLT